MLFSSNKTKILHKKKKEIIKLVGRIKIYELLMRMLDTNIEWRPDFSEIRDTILYLDLSLDELFLKNLI